ncbi:MAG: putative polysaccharide biosynthesis protein [Ruminococcus sp.]|jgi:stage V sporulation protein B
MSNKNSSFVKQATFLMVAGLIVRIIGLLYRTPMKAAIGGLGYGYYGYAYNVYNILLLISGYSIPVAVSKLMSERIAKKQYHNAQRIFWGAIIYILIIGTLAALVAFIFAKQLLPAGAEGAVPALRILAPVILLAGLLGVLRGYFQANNNMMPTSVSQILEQIFNAVVSVAAAWLLIRSFGTTEEDRASYGAAGGTLGTAAGVLVGILFMLAVFALNRKIIKKRIRRDVTNHVESASEIAKVILLMMTPVIFSTFIYNASAYIDQSIFSPLMLAKGANADDITTIYGVFSGQYMVLINIPVALANATSTAMMPQITGNYATGDYEEARNKIHEAVRMTMFIAIPAAVGLGVLAFPIMRVLFVDSPDAAGYMLIAGAVSVLFYSLSTITNGVLQGIGKQHLPLRNASISLVVNVAVLAALTWFTDLGIYSVLISTIAYSLCMCILNNLSVKKHLKFKNEFVITYGKPLAAAGGMGIAAWIIYYGLSIFVPSELICLVPAVLIAVIVYLVLFVFITKMKAEQLREYPMGGIIVRILRILRVLRE